MRTTQRSGGYGRTELAFALGLALLATACAPSRAELIAQLPKADQQLLADYERYMTESRVDRFMAATSSEAREEIVREVRLERMLSRYPPRIRSAIVRRKVVRGMHVYGLLIAWGRPESVQMMGSTDGAREMWSYEDLALEGMPPGDYEVVLFKKSVEKAWGGDTEKSVLEADRPSTELAVVHLKRGSALYRRGRHRLARLEFELARDLAPDEPNAYRSLAVAEAMLGNPGASAKAYRRYLELAPEAADAEQVRAILAEYEDPSQSEE